MTKKQARKVITGYFHLDKPYTYHDVIKAMEVFKDEQPQIYISETGDYDDFSQMSLEDLYFYTILDLIDDLVNAVDGNGGAI